MTLQNLHTHSTLDDGRASMEQMARAAAAQGLDALGFSGHSPLAAEYVPDWCIRADGLGEYETEFLRVKQLLSSKIPLYFGIEWDIFSEMDLTPYQYVIGSIHYIHAGGVPYTIDDTPQLAVQAVAAFGGDADAAAQAFFAQYRRIAENPQVDIVGHFDILTKFNGVTGLFDPESDAYRRSALSAMAQLVDAGKLFELNTGGMYGGYRTEPYPGAALLRALHRMGGRILISSDAHDPKALTYGFREARALAYSCGFRTLWCFNGTEFVPEPLKDAA